MKRLLILFVGIVLSVSNASAQYIWVNLSYKVILNPVDGTRPPGATDASIMNAVVAMNSFLSTYGRNHRMRLAHAPIEISGNYDNGPSAWYAFDFLNPPHDLIDWKDEMESAAQSDANYAWRNNAINLYINAGNNFGAVCSFPQEDDEIIIVGSGSAGTGWVHLHELGHYFGLYHTQGRACGCSGSGGGQCDAPGDDEIYDTLPDLPCWDAHQISLNAFGVPYASATADQRKLVDDTIQNIMSYHAANCGNGVPSSQLTERQLDVWADYSNSKRSHVVSGTTAFFDWRNNCQTPAGNSAPIDIFDECFFGPFPTLAPLANATPGGGDLVAVIRPGNYPGSLTISRAMTLVATRSGPVTIGQ